jgi:tRNA(Ile)-lysidine synthase
LLKNAGYEFACLHFQHDSPGPFAATSMQFCQHLCRENGIPLEVRSAMAEEVQKKGDLSWEAAASVLRYRDLSHRPGTFLTAHSADDQAETVIMRLLDGAGLAGLAGIRASRDGRVQRPLLNFRRAQLRDYLSSLGQEWVEDPSNLDGNDRARLRHNLLPDLEDYNPALVATLCRTAESLAADEAALTSMAREWLLQQTIQGDHWSLPALRALQPSLRHRVLREIWRQASDGTRRPLGGVFRDCERLVMNALDDRQVTFPGGCKLRKVGAWLWLEPPCETVPWKLPIPKNLSEPLRGESWVLLGPQHVDDLDPEWIRLPLPAGVFCRGKQYELRTRLPGDTYRERSLKKLLAATGHPPWVRDRWPLLLCADQVVAVPGLTPGTAVGEGTLLFRPERWRWSLRKMKL